MVSAVRLDEYFITGENICYISRTSDTEDWEEGLNYITKLITKYLDEGRSSNILKDVNAIGIGFVDGDINIIDPV